MSIISIFRFRIYPYKNIKPINSTLNIIKGNYSDLVAFGNIKKKIRNVKHPEYVPVKYYQENIPQSSLHHLRWMMQKDILGQDMFLLGPPGSRKRLLTMQYLELTNQEHEYLALNRDTTESDMKQRREIIDGTTKYFDQSAVKAAKEGRILILDGIEKAERNVLPVLNNLLENREMHLEDGSMLISASRYDNLLKEHGEKEINKWKLIRVNENFKVIALGLPVPKFRGNPLDPPLRSRFQAKDVSVNTYQEWFDELQRITPSTSKDKLEKLLSSVFALLSRESIALGFPHFPIDNVRIGATLLEANPHLTPYDIIYRLYPYKSFLNDGIDTLETLLSKFDVTYQTPSSNHRYSVEKKSTNAGVYIETNYQNVLLRDIMESYRISDFCMIGESGCGKSILVNELARIVDKQVENVVLYQDMTSRDLLQQRTTKNNGDTVWAFSPLVVAALEGKIAVLDGIHRIHPSTLSILHRLIVDRELQLPDGKRLINNERYEILQDRFGLSKEQLNDNGILEIHPDFRIVAIGEPPNVHSTKDNWISPELLSLFLFHEVRTLSKQEEMHVITSKIGQISRPLHRIIDLAHILRNSRDHALKNVAGHLSTRHLLRIAATMNKYETDPYEILEETFMIKFLPSTTRHTLEKIIKNVGIEPNLYKRNDNIKYQLKNGILTIGISSIPIYNTQHHTKVPEIVFFDIPEHVKMMEKLLQDFQLGHHLLLVGNQGVGKNKIVDRFLQLINRPREYIQLHRDTTVQTLTMQPSVEDGVLVYEDSPLVKAVKLGHVLVIDEADKAPIHVTCILKALVESGQMTLSDGRKIIQTIPDDNLDDTKYILTHPDFRLVVLANRPGFPFLGNDFFGALGDLFSCHAIENPSKDSETMLLKRYGPNVSIDIIERLVGVFGELRSMADQGLLSYPYSTREVVNIVKHLEKFPSTDLEDVLLNVFDFDRYSPELLEILEQVLAKHGLTSKNFITSEYSASKRSKENIQVNVCRYNGLDTKSPKHGKEDPKNEPHVGGNTWAGGTGGRDTAGLGGKGGPYRLDKGHIVHQLSEKEKNSVPEYIQMAAKEMGLKAFKQKLKEIGMSEYDHLIYSQLSNAVDIQVQSLRIILANLQFKSKERKWWRHQTSGELDDVKLIDGLLGEKNIFRRRAEQEPELGTPQLKPKLFRVVVDVSGSMYRFNSLDGRLDRELEAIVLVMEAFEGFHDKIKYDIIGHSGEEYNIQFVTKDKPPNNNKERLQVIRTMHAHSQYCWTGDNTLESAEWAISTLAKEDCDEAILVLLSDANLQRYGIPPSRLSGILTAHHSINSYAIFIGSLGDQAERILKHMPTGRAFICKDTSELPQILKDIFSSSVFNA